MQKIPDTFCPAKWDELLINFSYNMVYACCKATPVHFVNNYRTVMKSQQDNLLNGVKDPSCDYCWRTENDGNSSYRQSRYLKSFDPNTIELYKTGQAGVKYLEVNLGNSCNLQCIYCNPKFSSKWEEDIRFKKYPVVTDRFNYEIVKKNKRVLDQNIDFLSKFEDLETINIIGGEPLVNNKFFEVLEHASAEQLSICTNLSVDREAIDKLLSYSDKYKKVYIVCSIDATDDLSRILREGIDIDLFYDNLNYLIAAKKDNIEITIQSLMTNISVLDIDNSSKLFTDYITKHGVKWRMFYCKTPKVLSFEALPNYLRESLIASFEKLLNNDNILGPDLVIAALREIEFNKGIFREFDHFIKEWESRKNVQLPADIKEKLYAQTK